ncbi:hypothetical protein MDA_GLEAN10013272 [Myotis davidii]|uniref:Uncharacterized protein n=1 Tax=Myotis davidii TaxID=225400 RepID=L5MIN7_MYODS|nr:hypothetical protein MDA_GLEAN10013272 [Myotis davidii]
MRDICTSQFPDIKLIPEISTQASPWAQAQSTLLDESSVTFAYSRGEVERSGSRQSEGTSPGNFRDCIDPTSSSLQKQPLHRRPEQPEESCCLLSSQQHRSPGTPWVLCTAGSLLAPSCSTKRNAGCHPVVVAFVIADPEPRITGRPSSRQPRPADLQSLPGKSIQSRQIKSESCQLSS